MLKKYYEIKELINQIKVPMKKKFLYGLVSILFAFIIISGPLSMCINLMIFKDFQKILEFGIATLIVIFIFLVDYFYIKCIVKDKVKNIKYVVLTDTFTVAIIVYLTLIVIYFLG